MSTYACKRCRAANCYSERHSSYRQVIMHPYSSLQSVVLLIKTYAYRRDTWRRSGADCAWLRPTWASQRSVAPTRLRLITTSGISVAARGP